MRGSFCGAMLLAAAASFAPPLSGQVCNAQNLQVKAATLKEPVRYFLQPYSAECRNTTVRTDSNGDSVSNGNIEFDAWDSQGRYLLEVTDLSSGSSNSLVVDPAAGTRTVWNSGNSQAKTLKFSAPVPKRKSCWRIRPEDAEEAPLDDAQLGTTGAWCHPAGQHQPPFCQGSGESVGRSPGNLRITGADYEDCKRKLSREIMLNAVSEEEEDLGAEIIEGFETHGCRKTTKTAAGTYVRELWLAKFDSMTPSVSSMTSPVSVIIRSVEESRLFDTRVVKRTQEIISLRLEEPDPGAFNVPSGYATKTVEMHEVACEQSDSTPASLPAK